MFIWINLNSWFINICRPGSNSNNLFYCLFVVLFLVGLFAFVSCVRTLDHVEDVAGVGVDTESYVEASEDLIAQGKPWLRPFEQIEPK